MLNPNIKTNKATYNINWHRTISFPFFWGTWKENKGTHREKNKDENRDEKGQKIEETYMAWNNIGENIKEEIGKKIGKNMGEKRGKISGQKPGKQCIENKLEEKHMGENGGKYKERKQMKKEGRAYQKSVGADLQNVPGSKPQSPISYIEF